MTRRLMLAALAATGGLVTTAFLQATVAAADVSPTGDDAFTIGNFTFDPYSLVTDPANPDAPGVAVEGFTLVPQFTSAPPLLELGGVSALGLSLSPQTFEVFSPAGTDLGSISTGVTVTNLFGLTNTEFTVNSTGFAGTNLPLPTVGSVYDVFNLGNGYSNIYTAIPGGLDGSNTVTDTLITPNGSIDLTPLFGNVDAAALLQPGEAFLGLQTPEDALIGHDAFTLAGINWDPSQTFGTEGFNPFPVTASAPPLLLIGGASLGDPVGTSLQSQTFFLYDVDGSTATQIGFAQTGVEVTKLLGFTNTQIVVGDVRAFDDNVTTGLPTAGGVYDALNLNNGYTNVYTAIPGADGAPDKVTDTLITPNGNIDLTPLFGNIDAAAPLHPEDAFSGLLTGNSAIGPEAFTIGGTTFDPTLAAGGEGFDTVYQTVGAPPLLLLGGGNVIFPGSSVSEGFILAPQSFDVYDGNLPSDQLGSITTIENVTVLLGLTNTEFTVLGVTPTGDGVLPTVGSVYDVFNLGNGYENIYTAIAGTDGTADKITDTFVTPMGTYDLSSLFGNFDPVPLLNPGDAFAGLDAAAGAAGAADPLAFLGL